MAWIQALYYASTGVWPLFDLSSFQAVTGPKTDLWLVQTVGALLAATGGVLGWAAYRKRLPPELVAVAVSQALVLMLVDVVFVGIGRISPIYLLDALAETMIVVAWWGARASEHRRPG